MTDYDPALAERACKTKKPYTCRKHAKRAAKRSLRYVKYPLTVYHCRVCDHWHLTSNTDVGYKVVARRKYREYVDS